MVWYFHLLKNFPQFVVIHTVKGFGVVNKAEADASEANTNSRQFSQAICLNPTTGLEVSA